MLEGNQIFYLNIKMPLNIEICWEIKFEISAWDALNRGRHPHNALHSEDLLLWMNINRSGRLKISNRPFKIVQLIFLVYFSNFIRNASDLSWA